MLWLASARTGRLSPPGPPSACPISSPTIQKAPRLKIVPSPIKENSVLAKPIRTGSALKMSSTDATAPTGFAARSATEGEIFRTTIPTTNGARIVVKTNTATGPAGIARDRPTILLSISSDSGMKMIDRTAVATSKPIVCLPCRRH
jgi:hypothetical protein